MPTTLQAQQIMVATLCGALVVLFGAVYALFFALSKLQRKPVLMTAAYAAYGAFTAAAIGLALALDLTGFWLGVIAVMLLGYLLAPHGVWHLCVGTHSHSKSEHEGELL